MKDEYLEDSFPPYCIGWYYLLTSDLIKPILRELPYCTYFWIDDVHITGHIAQRAQAHFENWTNTSMMTNPKSSAMIDGHVIFMLTKSVNERKQIWAKLRRKYGHDEQESGKTTIQKFR
ncbi:unnamed protein product [Gongylonema pulchrum]|nr:unnamed protein product [Gongylonema pulchrum]